jgi:site-specific recombinase XerD
MKLSDCAEGFLLARSTTVSPSTLKMDDDVTRAFIGWGGDCTAREVSADDLRRYLTHLSERGLSKATIKRYYTSLSAFFGWLASSDVGLIERAPTVGVKPPRPSRGKPKALARQKIEALVAACERSRSPRRDRAIVLCLLDTAARASELTGLTMEEVDLRSGRCRVLGKGDKVRLVYLGRRALSSLWLYIKDERPEPAVVADDRLFLSSEGCAMDRHSLRLLLRRLRHGSPLSAAVAATAGPKGGLPCTSPPDAPHQRD